MRVLQPGRQPDAGRASGRRLRVSHRPGSSPGTRADSPSLFDYAEGDDCLDQLHQRVMPAGRAGPYGPHRRASRPVDAVESKVGHRSGEDVGTVCRAGIASADDLNPERFAVGAPDLNRGFGLANLDRCGRQAQVRSHQDRVVEVRHTQSDRSDGQFVDRAGKARRQGYRCQCSCTWSSCWK